MTNVAAHDLKPEWFPVRITYLRDGVVLETVVVDKPGVLQVKAFGPGAICIVEFGDGQVEVSRVG